MAYPNKLKFGRATNDAPPNNRTCKAGDHWLIYDSYAVMK